jgi:hypothetical protein
MKVDSLGTVLEVGEKTFNRDILVNDCAFL